MALLEFLLTVVLFMNASTESVTLLRVESLEYPVVARLARIEGHVEMDIQVGADGTVLSVNVKSGHPLLQEAAKANVKTWLLDSGRERTIAITYRFVLEAARRRCPQTRLIYELPQSITVISNLQEPDH